VGESFTAAFAVDESVNVAVVAGETDTLPALGKLVTVAGSMGPFLLFVQVSPST
jgi:hypothetical protein